MNEMQVRPDDIYRTGVVQPFNVVSQSPVRFARNEVVPFINAVRPGSVSVSSGGNASSLGIVSPEVLRTLGCAGGTCGALGQTAEEKYKAQRWYFGVGGVVLGALAAWAVGRMW